MLCLDFLTDLFLHELPLARNILRFFKCKEKTIPRLKFQNLENYLVPHVSAIFCIINLLNSFQTTEYYMHQESHLLSLTN